MRRALVAANGYGRPGDLAGRSFDLIVAVDGGLEHLEALGLTPDIIIGDLDSAGDRQELKSRYPAAAFRVYPPEKNATDLELALDLLSEETIDEALLIGAVGGRVDHELGNLLLLERFRAAGIDVAIETEEQTLFLIENTRIIEGRAGDLFSLIPLETLSAVTLQGFAYPLDAFRLERGSTRGLSNVITTDSARVQVTGGLALVILTKK